VNFFLDHDVPERVAEVLRREGHSVITLHQALPRDSLDPEVWRYAQDQHMVLVTCNRQDFLSLAGSRAHAGLIILIRRRSRIAECAGMLRLVRKAGPSGITGNINFA
jgi:predicted nuclease of predicted toxin-antitoxin system